jgi:ribose-phosphate pyrophosphokinase
MSESPLLFCLDDDRRFGQAVADRLGLALSPFEDRQFEDGEHKTRPLLSVLGADAYLLVSLCGEPGWSINDKLLRLLFFVATLRDCGAARLTVVTPYLGYARKDRRTKDHDPVSSRYLAQLIEAVGTDRVVALEVHNPAAFQNAFRCPSVHLESRGIMAAALEPLLDGQPATVVSPDAGGMKRAERLREALEARLGCAPALAIMEKRRSEGRVSGELLAGELENRVAVRLAASGARGQSSE